MKKLTNQIAVVSGVAFLLLLTYTAFSRGNNKTASHEQVSGDNPAEYPGPLQEGSPTTEAYPGDVGETGNQPSAPIVDLSMCGQTGSWLAYENMEYGFKLDYPSEAELNERSDGITIELRSQCYDLSCANTRDQVSLRIFDNSGQLNLYDFIVEEFKLNSYPPTENSMENLQNGISLQVGEQALRIEDGITLAFPDIFIARQGKVYWLFVPQDPPLAGQNIPCSQTFETFEEIVSSFDFLVSVP